jgi:DNA-binding SARP family transcriptional activator
MSNASERFVDVAAESSAPIVVHLIDGLSVTVGKDYRRVPEGCKRLIAFLALRKGPLKRGYVAGSLWPTVDDMRASGNLRSAVWRLREARLDVVSADRWSVWLTPGTAVDIDGVRDWAQRVFEQRQLGSDLHAVCEKMQGVDILPGFYDDWAIAERERMRQQILHAFETVSHLLSKQGRCGEAVDVAMAAVFCEPLRESAQRALVESHLAEGNVVEARRAYTAYAKLIARELGASPSPEFASLLRSPERPCDAVARYAESV